MFARRRSDVNTATQWRKQKTRITLVAYDHVANVRQLEHFQDVIHGRIHIAALRNDLANNENRAK